VETHTIETPHGPAQAHLYEVDAQRGVLVIGHGAGGGIGAKDLVAAKDVALSVGLGVALVEQPYRLAGRRSPPPAAHLDTAWLAVVGALRGQWFGELPLVVGGRSSGARVACRTAHLTGAVGVLCLAFPLQPPQGERPTPRPNRLPELEIVGVEVLIVQGENDRFGIPPSAPRRTVIVVAGDHSLRRGLDTATPAVGEWLARVVDQPPRQAPRSRRRSGDA
jgi:predicted alpha/beta-hydrolase family hydrolase